MSRRSPDRAATSAPEVDRIVERLVSEGARLTDRTALRADRGCTLDVRPADGVRTIWRIQLDVDGATYCRTGGGRQSRICDFLVMWATASSSFGVAEMKSGAATQHALDQLRAGLDLIARVDVDQVLRPRRAWLVCQHQNDQLKKLLQTRRATTLPFRGRNVPVVVLRCGERITLE